MSNARAVILGSEKFKDFFDTFDVRMNHYLLQDIIKIEGVSYAIINQKSDLDPTVNNLLFISQNTLSDLIKYLENASQKTTEKSCYKPLITLFTSVHDKVQKLIADFGYAAHGTNIYYEALFKRAAAVENTAPASAPKTHTDTGRPWWPF